MGCCAPNAVGPGPAAADPCKRVNYTLGMLLGVDDFVQESEYNGARRREMARELFGYGTVHGLQVVVEPEDDRGPRVRVMPGMAWLPSGTPVCVDGPQCANLNDWLAAHAAELPSLASGDTLDLYLVLSHAQCLTDKVPIPGEPCRDDSELMQPSRVADGFRLELRLAPPPQREEDAIRDFVAWLLSVPLAASSPPLDEEEFVAQLRAAAHAWLAPTSPPPASPSDYLVGGAPAGTSEQLLAAALRLWTTELRPLWMARADCGCSGEPIAPRDDAVLLAELAVDVVAGSPNWVVRDTGSPAQPAVRQDEGRRPYVLSLRMLQELITLHPVPDPAESVVSETDYGQAPKTGVSLHYARADHSHGTPPLPVLDGDVQGVTGNTWVDALQGVKLLAASPLVNGQVLTVQGGQWMPRALPPAPVPPLGGDLSGSVGSAHVDKLKGVPLVTTSPLQNGHVLTVQNGQWMPRPLPPAPTPAPIPSLVGDVTGAIGNNTISALQKVPVNADKPEEGNVLYFDGDEWIPMDAATALQFVGRGNPLPYEIVAAAEVTLVLAQKQLVSQQFDHRYADLAFGTIKVNTSDARIEFRLGVAEVEPFTGFVVKLTPIRLRQAFRMCLADRVKAVSGKELEIQVLLEADAGFEGDAPFAFQMEISRYGEKLG